MMLQALEGDLDGGWSRPAAAVFAYDVFVVHAAADAAFVHGYLLPALGVPLDRALVPGALELGRSVVGELERAVRSSRITIVVLSRACIADHWAAFGEQLAACASVVGEARGVLPVLRDDCELPLHLRTLVGLDFRDSARDAWQGEAERLRAYVGGPAAPEPELPCPYPGMRPFQQADAARFFGRDTELDRIVRRLRRGEREICIIGASGSGKSSLVVAGLLPRLAGGVPGLPRFLVRMFRPGERPLERLAAALEGDAAAPVAAVGALLEHHAAPAAVGVSPDPGAAPGALLLVIDQLEEMFAIADDDQRRGLFAALRALRAEPRCALVFTLRADFYGAFMDCPLWTDCRDGISRVDLGPLCSESLRMVIERPARDLGVYFQPELVRRLLDDAAAEPGALPLLQETLFQLWAKRRHRLLALADYDAMSDGVRTGLAFAVKEHADDVLGALPPEQRPIALRILLRLVNFGEGRADTRRQQPRDALRSDGEAAADFDAVLQRLVDHRLVTISGEDEPGAVRVDLAHEVLIQAWPAFAAWIRTWRAHEQRRRGLEAAAAAWRTRSSGAGGLLDAIELADAVAWRKEAAQPLGHTADLAAFLAASEATRSRVLRRRQRRRAQRNRLLAESAQLYQETGRQWLVEAGRPLEALPYLVAARKATEAAGGSPGTVLRMLFADATRNLPIARPLRHRDAVASAAFDRTGTRVVTASFDHTALIWDAVTGKRAAAPLEHQHGVASAVFSPDGTRVVTASGDATAQIWDAATGAPISPPLAHHGFVASAVFSPDGRWVVTASGDRTAKVWDATTGCAVGAPMRHQEAVTLAMFSPDGARVVTASFDHTARLWDAATGRAMSPPLVHRDVVRTAAFSPDGARVVTASGDKTARIWDVATGRAALPQLPHWGAVASARFGPDGARIVTASEDGTARLWDAATGVLVAPPLQHHAAVVSAAFSADGARIVTASHDRTARIWDVASGRPLSPPLAHHDSVVSAAFSPDGTCVITASADQTARIWDGATSAPLALKRSPRVQPRSVAFSPDGVRGITPQLSPLEQQSAMDRAAFSPDGTRIVTASFDHTARLWDTVARKHISLPHHDAVNSAAFSADGARIVTASRDRTARIWDATTGQPLSPPVVHGGAVKSAVFSADGARIVTASRDKTARVWDAATGRPLAPPFPHHEVVYHAAFSPDGTRVVTASQDKTARVWDVATGKPLSPPLLHHEAVYSAAFSPDGTRIVTACGDHTARIWDAATGKPLSSHYKHQVFIVYAAFSPNGMRVVTTSADHTTQVWELPLASGTLAEWRAIADRACPYVLADGVLSPRADEPAAISRTTLRGLATAATQ